MNELRYNSCSVRFIGGVANGTWRGDPLLPYWNVAEVGSDSVERAIYKRTERACDNQIYTFYVDVTMPPDEVEERVTAIMRVLVARETP